MEETGATFFAILASSLERDVVKQTIRFTPAKYDITTVISDNEQPKLQVTLYFFSNFLF